MNTTSPVADTPVQAAETKVVGAVELSAAQLTLVGGGMAGVALMKGNASA